MNSEDLRKLVYAEIDFIDATKLFDRTTCCEFHKMLTERLMHIRADKYYYALDELIRKKKTEQD